MKKTIIFFPIFLLVSFCASAQDELLDILTDETCKCISTPDFSSKSSQDMQMALGLCMIEKALPYNDRIKSELGIDLLSDGEDGGRRLGEQIGFKLVGSCPAFQQVLDKMLDDGDLTSDDLEVEFGSFSGTIKEFKNEGFMNLVVKPEGERPQKFLWLDYFDGSEDIIGNFDKYVGKNVEVEYQKMEVFLPEAGDYFQVKKIVSLRIQ